MLWHKVQGAGGVGLEYSFVTSVTGGSTANDTVTFSGVDLGEPRSDRLVVVGVGAIRANSTGQRRIVSATIAGVSASIAPNTNPYANTVSSIIYAEVPTGTSGNIVIVFEGNAGSDAMASENTIGVYTLYRAQDVQPVDSDYQTGTATPSITLSTVPAGAAIYMCAGGFNSTDIEWSGDVVEDFFAAESNRVRSSASAKTTGSSITGTATQTGPFNAFLSAAFWR